MKEIRGWKKVLESDLDYIASEVVEFLETPSVVILNGPVGAGKTTFTKRFVRYALSKDNAREDAELDESFDTQSPTYSLVNEIDDIVHADLYRIKDPEEIVHLELPLYVEDKEYVLIEWGTPLIEYVRRECGDDFSYYSLSVDINDGTETRNFHLYSIASSEA